MNTLVKFAAPAILAFAAFGAQAAGQGQSPDYGGSAPAAAVSATAGAHAAGVSFRGDEANGVRQGVSTMRSIDEVRREATQPRGVNPDYIA